MSRNDTYYIYDPLGNVYQRTDHTGAYLNSERFTAWGVPLTGTGYAPDAGDPYGYKAQYGYYKDRDTGLILCTHRYYDPSSGHWLTRDPIGYEGGLNVYEYCGDDPVNEVDPSGEDWETGL